MSSELTRGNEAGVVDRLHLVHVELVHDVVQKGVQVIQELDRLGRDCNDVDQCSCSGLTSSLLPYTL